MATWAERLSALRARFQKNDQEPVVADFLHGQPFEVRSFMDRFQPANVKEKALYNYMVEHSRIDNVSLATIADSSLLSYLWENHQESQDYSVRKAIIENPRCSQYILEQGLADNDWEVRKAAVQRPELSTELCIQRAKREGNPFVKQALQERLDSLYPTVSDPPIPLAAMQALAKTQDGRTVAMHAGAVPVESQKLPLGAQIQAAEVQRQQRVSSPFIPSIQRNQEER